MLESEEKAFEIKAEKMLKGHRELPSGRDYRAFYERFRLDTNNEDFNSRWDSSFPRSPATDQWFDLKYCSKCDKQRQWCECQ